MIAPLNAQVVPAPTTPPIPTGQPVITTLGRYVAVPPGASVALSCRSCGETYAGTSGDVHAALRSHWVGTHPMPTRPAPDRPPTKPRRRTGNRKHVPYVRTFVRTQATCPQCGAEFTKRRPHSTFCSEPCRRRAKTARELAKRLRQRAEAVAA